MSNDTKLTLFHLLSIVTTGLAITTSVLSFYPNWKHTAGAAVLACIIYQIRIWLVVQVMKTNG